MICCLSMAALGTTTYLTRFDDQSLSSNLDSALRWLSLVFLITFVLGFTLGLGPVPWILVGELKPGKNTSVNKSMKWKLYVFSSFRLYQVAWGRLLNQSQMIPDFLLKGFFLRCYSLICTMASHFCLTEDWIFVVKNSHSIIRAIVLDLLIFDTVLGVFRTKKLPRDFWTSQSQSRSSGEED